MLIRWAIENFKSAYEPTEIELRPITIFAGANSSGKSTFIHSILLVTQTLNSRLASRPVVLNGHIARLGSFDDLASVSENPISFGFTFRLPDAAGSSPPRARTPFAISSDAPLEVGCNFSFSPAEDATSRELSQLQPKLSQGKLWTVRKDSEDNDQIQFRRTAVPAVERAAALNLAQPTSDELEALEYEVDVPSTIPARPLRYLGNEVPLNATPAGLRFYHFLPSDFAVAYDATEHGATMAVRYVTQSAFQASQYARPPSIDKTYLTESLLKRVLELTRPYVASAKEQARPSVRRPGWPTPARGRPSDLLGLFQQALQTANVDFLIMLQRLIDAPGLPRTYEESFQELVKLARGDRPDNFVLGRVPAAREASHTLQMLFGHYVKYLGPLRDEPKPVYPMEGSIDPSDVGLKGEFTAAVLDLNKHRKIVYIPSERFVTMNTEIGPREDSLQAAVLDWLTYLGVVSHIETHDKGVFGHELRVAPAEGDKLHNLVHVGVGVSQVLPILVMSLLADPESVLVFEQPELHLHPKVQTLLADFLLSMALLRKQCIVETHSEYLINRLRLRAAQDLSDTIQDLLGLYFVEKQGSRSSYRSIRVNEYGAVGDWPSGFFDQAPQEAERILRAALDKRKARRAKHA